MVLKRMPSSLETRFPRLQHEIRLLLEGNSEFQQLSDDYELLIESLAAAEFGSNHDREEILKLKASLEFEALEKLLHTKLIP